jgi:hypothetical protein
VTVKVLGKGLQAQALRRLKAGALAGRDQTGTNLSRLAGLAEALEGLSSARQLVRKRVAVAAVDERRVAPSARRVTACAPTPAASIEVAHAWRAS